MLIYLILILVIFSFWLVKKVNLIQKNSGIPNGRVIYADSRNWRIFPDSLYEPNQNLIGKPDYLVQTKNGYIPVEVKKSKIPSYPFLSHIYQLAAYLYLVEYKFGKKPKYGILHYIDPNKLIAQRRSVTYAVNNTPSLIKNLLGILKQMHEIETNIQINRSHDQITRCTRCGYKNICDQRLG